MLFVRTQGNITTARIATSMSALPILAVQKISRFSILVSVGCQGWGCSLIKRDRELGSERCEAVCLISTGSVNVSERKDLLVREERRFVASGGPVI